VRAQITGPKRLLTELEAIRPFDPEAEHALASSCGWVLLDAVLACAVDACLPLLDSLQRPFASLLRSVLAAACALPEGEAPAVPEPVADGLPVGDGLPVADAAPDGLRVGVREPAADREAVAVRVATDAVAARDASASRAAYFQLCPQQCSRVGASRVWHRRQRHAPRGGRVDRAGCAHGERRPRDV
jgi:hypothetical protein